MRMKKFPGIIPGIAFFRSGWYFPMERRTENASEDADTGKKRHREEGKRFHGTFFSLPCGVPTGTLCASTLASPLFPALSRDDGIRIRERGTSGSAFCPAELVCFRKRFDLLRRGGVHGGTGGLLLFPARGEKTQ